MILKILKALGTRKIEAVVDEILGKKRNTNSNGYIIL
jgi:hypothetical protein